MIIISVKTETQITNISNKIFCQVIETLVTVRLFLHVRKLAGSKELINMLSNFHLSMSYDKLLKIETLSNAVVKKMESSNVTYISPGIQHGNRLHLTIDNVDFHNNTFDGKNEFQGTSQAVFQKSAIVVPKLIINRTDSLKPSEYTLKIEVKDKLSLQGESFPSFPESLDVDLLQQCKKKGQICYLYQVTEETMAGILPA